MEIPSRWWTKTGKPRKYTALKGRSKNFNEELRLWVLDHNGTIVWTQVKENERTSTSYLINNGEMIPKVWSCHTYRDTWMVYFKEETDAVLFKLTWY